MSTIGRGLGWLLTNLQQTNWDEEEVYIPESESVNIEDQFWSVSEDNIQAEAAGYAGNDDNQGSGVAGLFMLPAALLGCSMVYMGALWLKRVCRQHNVRGIMTIMRGVQQFYNWQGGRAANQRFGGSGPGDLEIRACGLEPGSDFEPSCPAVESDACPDTVQQMTEDGAVSDDNEVYEDAVCSPAEMDDDKWSIRASQGSICGDVDFIDITIAECMVEDDEVAVRLLDKPLQDIAAPQQQLVEAMQQPVEQVNKSGIGNASGDTCSDGTLAGCNADQREILDASHADFNRSSRCPLSSTVIERVASGEQSQYAGASCSVIVDMVELNATKPSQVAARKCRGMQGLDETNVIGRLSDGVKTRRSKE